MHGEMTRRQAIQGLAALAPAALATTPMAARALAGGGTAGSTAAQAGEPFFEPALGLFQARRQGRQLAYRIGVVVTARQKPPGLVRRALLGSGR